MQAPSPRESSTSCLITATGHQAALLAFPRSLRWICTMVAPAILGKLRLRHSSARNPTAVPTWEKDPYLQGLCRPSGALTESPTILLHHTVHWRQASARCLPCSQVSAHTPHPHPATYLTWHLPELQDLCNALLCSAGFSWRFPLCSILDTSLVTVHSCHPIRAQSSRG